jgi:hypothetical protein
MINRINRFISKGKKLNKAFQTHRENQKDWIHAGAEVWVL